MMVKQGTSTVVPRLRFPEFRGTNGWQAKPLGSICEVQNNRRRPITSNDRVPGPYPYYGASGVVDFVNNYIFDERLLLVGEDGAKWGRFESTAFIAKGKYWVNNHAHVLKAIGVKDSLLENYLTMLDVAPFVTGAAPPKLTLAKLKGIPIPVPSTSIEQQKIADCLTSLDEVIAAQGRIVAALKAHKRGLMQQLFPREGETRPRLRFPEFRNAPEWALQSLDGFIEEFREKSSLQDEYEVLTSARAGLIRQRDYYDNDRIAERDNVGFNVIPPNYLTYRSRSDDRRFYFNENNLGITGIISTYYPVFRIREGSNKFFIELLSQHAELVGKVSVGTSQTVLSLKELRRIKLPIPSSVEQQMVATSLASIDTQITAESNQLTALKTHKQGLMQQLFPSREVVAA